MLNEMKEGNKEYVVLSVIGRDRPGIVASVSQVLCRNRYNIEALSQNAIMGQFAMILIASASNGNAFGELRKDCDQLMKDRGLDIYFKKTLPEETVSGIDGHQGSPDPRAFRMAGQPQSGRHCGD